MADRRKLKVLFASAEAVPFSKSGGLGDVAGSLPRAIQQAGAKVCVISPKYGTIAQEYKEQMVHVADFYVPLSWRSVYCGIEKLTYQGLDFYFIDNEAYFKRDTLYGYFDDGERFAFFSKAICEAMVKVPELQVDVLHCNDWHCAMAPVFLREFYMQVPECAVVKTVFSVHNAMFQGQYSDKVLSDILGLADIPAAREALYCAPQSINFMKGALIYSDLISTVSPTYANELQMPYYGEGMDSIFRRRAGSLSGILNGIDNDEWDPETDPAIPAHFSASDLSGKAECKRALQEEFGLKQDPNVPLVCMVGRLTRQKGLDLVRYSMKALMARGIQFAILGTGDKDYEDSFKYFDWKYGDMLGARIDFDLALSHRMYAGADIFLMPSEFEPCGLAQMISMRYGTLPVVRETGGLRDSVMAYNQFTGEGTGFTFANMNADEMAACLLMACDVYRENKDAWNRLQQNAFAEDFSWARAAEDYLKLYKSLYPELAQQEGIG